VADRLGINLIGGVQRGVTRPYNGVCYLGAYQFDGDYIFADGVDVKL